MAPQAFAKPDSGGLRGLAERSNIDLVDLTDFDVQIALTKNEGVQIYEVLNIVTQFMTDSFRSCMVSDGTTATFDTIILLERSRRRQLDELERELDTTTQNGQVVVGELFTAEFKGATLFSRNSTQAPVDPSLVEGCQRQAFLQDALLLNQLQASGAAGLGPRVVDVRAYINPNPRSNARTSSASSGSKSLEVVIIIAIVIACVAFMFLVFAIFWAWRYDKKNRDAYLSNSKSHASDDRTYEGQDSPESKNAPSSANKNMGSPEANIPSYPSVIGGDSVAEGVYPESVISEDINSSLTQYYQSGLQNYTSTSGRLQDAGSVSSMESYGYSLDGYAPSLATPMPSDNISTTPGDASVVKSTVVPPPPPTASTTPTTAGSESTGKTEP